MKERIQEIICIVLTAVFIAVIVSDAPDSQKTVGEVCDSVIKVLDTSELKESPNIKFKEEFFLNPNDFDGVVYYIPEDTVINVKEFLLVRLKDDSQKDQLIENIEKRVEEKIRNFDNGYDPKNKALLENHVLECTRGFILYAVCDNPEQVVQAFKDSL